MKKKSLFLTALATLGLTAATLAQSVPSYVPSNGLVGWWPFNGNANDESGNGNNGTVNGASITSDRFGNANNAYSFDGVSNYIQLPNNAFVTPPNITVCFWFKIMSNQINQRLIRQRASGFDVGYNMQIQHGNDVINKLNSNLYISPTDYYNPIFNNIVNDQQWHQFAFSYDGLNYKIYIDSILSYQTNSNGLGTIYYNNTGNGFTIGRDGDNPDWYLNGLFDDLGIWNRALTQQEITNLYNTTNCANNTIISPQANYLSTGNTAIFTVITSDPNPSYIWQSNLGQGFQTLNNIGNYSGTNTGTLNIANVQLPNHTQPIRVISTSGNCIDTSTVAVINILDTCITNVTVYDTLLTTVTDTLVINATLTGLNPPFNQNMVKVFPNPANTHITIDYGNFAIMNGYQLVIENSLGQQMFQTAINQQSNYISLASWTGNGLYFVHIIDPQGNTIDIRKIILQ